MARRADHTREELKSLAIRAGLELIKKEGFAKFSARKVASQIGYTVGTLYNIFGNYDELILNINAATLDEWYEFMQTALVKAKKADPLRTLATAYIEFSRTHYQQWITLFEYHLTEEQNPPEWYVQKMARFFDMVEAHLLPMLGNRRKTKRAAHVLWAGIHGICVLSLSGKFDLVKAEPPETLALLFINSYIAGLTKE